MAISEPMTLRSSSITRRWMTTRSSTNKKSSLASSSTIPSPQQSSSSSSSSSSTSSNSSASNLKPRRKNGRHLKSSTPLSSHTIQQDDQKRTRLANDIIRMGTQVDAWKQDLGDYYRARIVERDHEWVFIHYEGFTPEHAEWVRLSDLRPSSSTKRRKKTTDNQPVMGGKYGPKGRESPSSWESFTTFYYTQEGADARQHTGLVHDRRMAFHSCPCHSKEFTHPERPDRLASILQQLHNDRLLRHVKHVRGREATSVELVKAHTIQHVRNYTSTNIQVAPITMPLKTLRGIGGGMVKQSHRPQPHCPPDLVCEMVCEELGIAVDTTFHPLYTSVAAKVAAGSLITLVDAIVQGQLKNGFALIRPPGHHAEDDAAMGYCFFNNVAVAALSTLDNHPQIKKILIIDWDIHHGNGTQKIFYDNPNVLYISIHRWDHGEFYPHTGAPEECGSGQGLGKNVNIALNDDKNQTRPMGDPEFIAAFYHLIMPIATQFGPDMIFVSAGFDAAAGHPENLGGYMVTPRGFSLMTQLVMELAQTLCDGKLVLTLEGGYALQPLAVSAAACVAQLLRHPTSDRPTLNSIKPNQGCVASLAKCVQIQQSYWHLDPSPRFLLPQEWLASKGILTRPKRGKRSNNVPMVEGY